MQLWHDVAFAPSAGVRRGYHADDLFDLRRTRASSAAAACTMTAAHIVPKRAFDFSAFLSPVADAQTSGKLAAQATSSGAARTRASTTIVTEGSGAGFGAKERTLADNRATAFLFGLTAKLAQMDEDEEAHPHVCYYYPGENPDEEPLRPKPPDETVHALPPFISAHRKKVIMKLLGWFLYGFFLSIACWIGRAIAMRCCGKPNWVAGDEPSRRGDESPDNVF
mmetsp:Transcript_56510/g.157497  ORF Transcript_56510/g.157497 Transcript_56510/m.157497 type:complete len:223 (-) Transcript_56510:133-801(-)|eukprot:CAMPEP_0117580628 /NCGR_PEP_ID=MMETSP0784-20121206/65324_1 /TAXON_ID=39447 /ORGANISM="" /LENGTH=222 /DNA_ID=CAMNT_0005380743 /DNA_START=89 /DNA_END=757 /DNA_ORIENTATION=-